MLIDPEIVRYHLNMLNDRARTSGFLECIRATVQSGDVVLDIGTGTGVYAMAAAQAGARHVYAIEAGPIARVARQLFRANGLDRQITLLRGLSTRLWLPERADVLISEVIGNEPLAEGVLRITRDALRRLVKPGGLLIPERIKIYGQPVSIPEDDLNKIAVSGGTLHQWHSWYGLDFNSLAMANRNSVIEKFFDNLINPNTMQEWMTLSEPVLFADLHLGEQQGVWIDSRRTVTANAAGQLNGIVTFFELHSGPRKFLSTAPAEVDTSNHWLSPVRLLLEPLDLCAGDLFEVGYWYNRARGASGCEVRLHR
jgi:type I protein arginine methyltransferase